MRRLRNGRITVIGSLLVIIASLGGCQQSPKANRAGPTENQLEKDPLTISASERGRYSKGYSWTLNVNPAGKALLTIDAFPESKKRELATSNAQIEKLRRSLIKERF